jgi:hypothetical protein
MTEWPERGEVSIDIGSCPDVLKSISESDITTLDIILREDHNIGILMCEVFIRGMALDKLIYRDLLSALDISE